MSQTDALPVIAQHAVTEEAPPQAHGNCENCHTTLHGHYCHACGQSSHNPLKHVGHAIEEVFESFWHLDGRIFRTLRDLLVPGKVAANFLKGQRVGYVQPLRLFVILTLFTFFVGKLTLHVNDFSVGNGGTSIYATAKTVEEVETLRAAQEAEITRQQKDSPTAAAAFAMAMAAVNTAAAQRTAELKQQAPATSTTESAMSRASQAATRAAGRHGTFFDYQIGGKPWDAETNPLVFSSLPTFVNNWLNRRLANSNANIERMGGKTDLYIQAILTALPGALFFLMPLFALVLRVAYVGRGIGYLEHLVVALYSHAWLMLVLLATFVTIGITGAIGNPVVNVIADGIYVVLWMAMPVYLLWMQQRVYGGRWWVTLPRYLFIGSIYFFLVVFVVMYAVLAGVSA